MPSETADESPKRKKKSKSQSLTINRGDQPKHTNLSDYLEKNSQITTKSATKESSFSAEDITSDDEIYLIQCPKTIDIERLNGTKIKSTGKKTITEKDFIVEIESNAFGDHVNFSTLLCNERSKKSKNIQAISFQPTGFIKIQKRVDEIGLPAVIEHTTQTFVPYPKDLKIRHPIHGYNYENIIQLPDKIKERIQRAVRMSNFKCKAEKKDHDKVESPCEESPKKKLKRKRNTSIMDHLDDEEKVSPKKNKNSQIENDSTNLDWLASI